VLISPEARDALKLTSSEFARAEGRK